MENALTMLWHAVLIGVALYVVMYFLLKQRQTLATDRSILLAAVALVYMILFGHGLPSARSLNREVLGL